MGTKIVLDARYSNEKRKPNCSGVTDTFYHHHGITIAHSQSGIEQKAHKGEFYTNSVLLGDKCYTNTRNAQPYPREAVCFLKWDASMFKTKLVSLFLGTLHCKCDSAWNFPFAVCWGSLTTDLLISSLPMKQLVRWALNTVPVGTVCLFLLSMRNSIRTTCE